HRGVTGKTQNKDKGPEHMHAVLLERSQPLRQVVARLVEGLENRLQSFFGDGFHAHKRAMDARLTHGVQKLRVLARFHGDLSEKRHVLGELCQLLHQVESLRSHGFQFFNTGRVALLFGQLNVRQSDGIEVIIRQRDEAKTETPQLHDLLDHDIRTTLARLLAIGSPYRAERTMLRAATYRLYGC